MVRFEVTRNGLIATLIVVGCALIVAGWLVDDREYLSALLLQIGSSVLLVVPILYVERLVTRRVDAVRDELEDLKRQAESVAQPYEQIRDQEESGRERTAKLERLMSRARADARKGRHDAGDVAALFHSGSDGSRIYALGLMQGKHALADIDAIVDAIEDRRSPFEQYQALLLAQRAWKTLGSDERRRVVRAIDVATGDGGDITRHGDRYEIARSIQILAQTS